MGQDLNSQEDLTEVTNKSQTAGLFGDFISCHAE